MKETRKKINEGQIVQLREHSNDEDIEFFFHILNLNFGEGEILPFNHILSFFEKGMFNAKAYRGIEKDENYLGYYVDSFRTLNLLSEDPEQLLLIDKESIISYHMDITRKFNEEASEVLKTKFKNNLKPFKRLINDYGTYRTELIGTIEELDWEGKFMNHCIATYRHIVADGKYVGLKFINENSWERLTIGLHVKEDNSLVFDQLKGHSNFPATKESCEFVIDFCEKNNIECNPEMNYDLQKVLEQV